MNVDEKLPFRGQQGSILMITTVFLVVLGLMGLTSMQMGKLELRMAANEETRANAFQIAQSLIDAVNANPAMTPIRGGPGYTVCTPGMNNCNSTTIHMPDEKLAPEVEAGHLSGTAILISTNSPPPRGMGYSTDKFSGTRFRMTADYAPAESALGRAQITQGLLVLTSQN